MARSSLPSSSSATDALLLGLASGLRTFMAPAALAARERPLSRVGGAMLLAAAGELVVDKLPMTPSRLQPPGLAGRLSMSAWSGHRVAGPAGALLAAAAAMASAQAGYRMRMALPGPLPALAEDALAITLAARAT